MLSVTDLLPESWGGTLGFIFSPVKHCYLVPCPTWCRLESPLLGTLWWKGQHAAGIFPETGCNPLCSWKVWAISTFSCLKLTCSETVWRAPHSRVSAAVNGTTHVLRALRRARTRALGITREKKKYLPQTWSWALGTQGKSRKKSKEKWNRASIHARAGTATQVYSLSVLCLLPYALD